MAAHDVGQQVLDEELIESRASGALWAPVSSKLLSRGDRRLEASTFLTDGFGLRQGLEGLSSTVPLVSLAECWMPNRLKRASR